MSVAIWPAIGASAFSTGAAVLPNACDENNDFAAVDPRVASAVVVTPNLSV